MLNELSLDTPVAPVENKAEKVLKATAEKQARLTQATQRNRERLLEEFNKQQERPRFTASDFGMADENLAEKAARGIKTGILNTANTATLGVAAGLSAVAESMVGEGGLATDFKKAAVNQYAENSQEVNKYARPEDSFMYSLDQAKAGDYGAFADWLAYSMPNVVAQMSTMLVGGGIIGAGAKVAGKKMVGKVANGLVDKQAKAFAIDALKKEGLKATTASIAEMAGSQAIMKKATSSVATAMSQKFGMGTVSAAMSGGTIMGDLAEQTVGPDGENRTLTGDELLKGGVATLASAAIEHIGLDLGLKAFKGKLGKLPGVKGIGSKTGKLTRGTVAGLQSGVGEGAQEYIQTGFEQWGTGKDLWSEEAKRERIDAAAAGGTMGGPASLGGLASKSTEEQKVADEKREEKLRLKPQNGPGWKKTIKKAAETEEGVEKYTDPKSPDRNETTAVNVMHERVKREDVSPEEKIKVGNDAIKLFQGMYKERAELTSMVDNATHEEKVADPEKYIQAEEKISELTTRIDDTTPTVQAIAQAQTQEDAEPEQLLEDFRKAFVKEDGTSSGNLAQSIRNVFGSKASHAAIDPKADGYVDIDAQLSAYQGTLQEDERAEIQAGAKLQKSSGAVLEQVNKHAGRVNTDILEGSPEGDFKGIPQHLNGITVALGSGNTKLAQNLQNRLSGWAEKRNHRAEVFDGMYQAFKKEQDPSPELQREFDILSAERERQTGEKLFVNNSTEGLVSFMKLEATALQDAAAYGQKMLKTKPTDPNSMERDSQAAPPSAPAQGTSIPIQETPDKAGQEVVDAQSNPGGRLLPRQDAPEFSGNQSNQMAQQADQEQQEVVTPPDTPKTPGILKKEQILIDTGFSEKEIRQLKPAALSWYASQKDVSVDTLKAKLWALQHEGENPPKAALLSNLIKVKERQVSNLQKVERTKENPTVALSDKATTTLKNYFSKLGHSAKDVESISMVPHEKHKQGKDLKAIGDAFGVQVFLYEAKAPAIEQTGVATYTKDRFVFIDKNSTESHLGILGHEITHQLKRKHPDLYQKLDEHLEVSSDEFTKFKDKLLSNVKGTPAEKEYAKTAREELISMFTGEHFGNKSFWNKVHVSDKKLFHRLFKIVDRILEKAMAAVTPVSQHFKDLKKARKTLFEVMQEAIKREGTVLPEEESTAVTEPQTITTKHSEISIRGLKQTGGVSVHPVLDKSIQTFRKGFKATTNHIFKPVLDERFIDQDPIQYLVQEDGKLPEDVTEALMATAYKWLATQASGHVSNTMDSMKKILHLKNEDADLTPDAQRALRHIGIQANYPTESLGKEAFKLLGIKIGDNADHDLRDRMEQSLGSMIIGTLEQQKILQPTYVYMGNNGKGQTAPFGFDGLKAKQEDPNNPIYANVTKRFETNKKFIKGRGDADNPLHTMTFYKVASQPHPEIKGALIAHSRIRALTEAWETDRQAWDQIYKGEQNTKDYSWKPWTFKEGHQFLTKGAGALWTKEQSANLIKNMNIPWVANAPAMNVFLSLDRKAQENILGKKDTNTEHISEHETNKGINLGIDRSIARLDSWLTDAAEQDQGYASEFYIPAEPWKQERMGMNSSVSPQGDKMHRSFFNMKDWKRTMKLDNKEHYNLFMLGVGMYLDIEFTKEGGLEETVRKTEEKLQDSVIQDGIKAIRSLIERSDDISTVNPKNQANEEETEAIVAAVAEGEVNAQSLKSLVEYTRYLMAKESGAETFETTMTIEIDGTANGPAWGRWQFMKEPQDPLLHLAALQTGGFRFHENKKGETSWDLSEHLAGDLNHDAYQTTGFAWALSLISRERYLFDRQTNKDIEGWQRRAATKDIKKMKAFQEIMGEPINSKTGNVSKEMRKLSKPPTMKTMYSMGEKKLTKELISATINTIEQKAKKYRNDPDTLHALNQAVFDLTDTWLFPVQKINGDFVTNAISAQDVLKTKLSDKAVDNLTKHITYNQGKAMFKAVKKVFAEIKESTQELNSGLSLATVYYNTIRKGYIAQALSKSEKGILSNSDVKAIDKKLENLFPQIQGAGGSFLPMASMDDRRAYSEKHPVIQGYRKKDTKGKKIQTPIRKTTHPHQITKLSDPGVSGTVLSVQHLDAANANQLMAHYSFLNNHDGFTSSIFDAIPLAQKANLIFTKINSTYSVSESVANLLTTSQKVFNEKGKALAKEFPEFDLEDALYEEITKQSIGKKSEAYEDKGKRKYRLIPIFQEELNKVVENVYETVQYTAKVNQRQKKILSDHVQGVSQFAFPGGEHETGRVLAKDLYGVAPSEITKQRTEVLNENIQDMQKARGDLGYNKETTIEEVVETLASTQGDMSTDPADYSQEEQINKETVTNLYDNIKNTGSNKVDGPAHDTRLKRILTELVQGVIDPLDLFLKKDPDKETMGKFDADNNRVFISSHSGLLNQGISMSTGEVYVHELVHAVIHQALSANKHLRSKVSRLYDVVFKEMQKAHKGEEYRVFLNDPGIDITDPANTPEIELAQARYDYFFRTPDKRGGATTNAYTGVTTDRSISNHLDEFMAHALTNENFSNFLQGISLGNTQYATSTWKGIRGKNIQETMLNLFQAIIDFFRGRFTTVNKQSALEEAEALAHTLAMVQSRYKTKRFETARKFIGLTGRVSEKGNNLVKSAFHKVAPKAKTRKEAFDKLMDDPSLGGQLFREVYNKIDAMDQGILKTTAQEARGMTSRLADYYQMLTRRKRILDSAKESIDHAFTTVATGNFKKEPTTAQKITLTKAGLRPDTVVLLDSLGIDKLQKVYQDDTTRQAEIDKIITELSDKQKFPDTAQYANYYDRASMALGDFLIHSQFRVDEDAGLNAQLIAELSGTKQAGNISDVAAKKVESLIDQLSSLYAIGSLPASRRADFATIMQEDSEGVSKTLQLHKTLKEQAKETSFKGAHRLFIKGYTKSILNGEVSLKYGILEDEAEMRKAGYSRSPKPLPRDKADPYRKQDIYVYTAKTGRLNNLASGILSYTRNKAKGTSSRILAEQTDTLTGDGHLNTKKIIRNKRVVRDAMFKGKRDPKAKLTNNMVAKVDQAGNIIDYRYMMSEATKDAYLDQVNDFDVIIGSMAAQIVDKKVTPKINKELIQRLKQTYDEEYQDNPKAFMQIGPNVDDPAMIEQYYMIPEKTRKAIPGIWGGHGTMYVPKDLMTLAFGYRKYSIVDAFNKQPGERARVEQMVVALTNHIVKDAAGKTGRGIRAINTVEQLATELTHYAKDNIIVKSLTITLGNFGSNLMYLKMRGVPMITTLKYGWEAIKYGTQYQADVLKVNTLGIEKIQLKKENTPKAKQRLRVIEKELLQAQDAINRNPVADSIDSGLMPSLVDDVDTQGQQNYFPGRIEKYVDDKTKKLPKPVKTAGKVLFLSQDTEAYKVLNNGVKLTDFVGRHVLYNHYTKSQGMGQKEAAQKAIEEFINFDIASHRITEYLNEIGLLWFTKYATRIPMVAAKAIIDKPFDSFMSYLMSTHIGFDNIIDSTIPNIGYKVDTPPTAWAGSVDELITSQFIGSILP